MEIQENITNKVANSGLVTFDLSKHIPKGDRILLDIKEQLFQGLILREKDFREFVKNQDWSSYQDKYVAITCSTDAIVPTWAYMLLATKLEPFAKRVVFGNVELLNTILFEEAIHNIDLKNYTDQRIVIKGCADENVPVSAYISLTAALRPIAKSIMYGEPCSTVPLYKRKD